MPGLVSQTGDDRWDEEGQRIERLSNKQVQKAIYPGLPSREGLDDLAPAEREGRIRDTLALLQVMKPLRFFFRSQEALLVFGEVRNEPPAGEANDQGQKAFEDEYP